MPASPDLNEQVEIWVSEGGEARQRRVTFLEMLRQRGNDEIEITFRALSAKCQNPSCGSAHSNATELSVRHARIEKRPALPTLEFLVFRLLLAGRPFCFILGPVLFRRVPLLFCPGLDLRHFGGLRRIRILREGNSGDSDSRKNDADGNKGANIIHRRKFLGAAVRGDRDGSPHQLLRIRSRRVRRPTKLAAARD